MSRVVIIAGGGTGGHIYPGLAIGEQLRNLDPEIEILFVGTPHGLEKEIVPRANVPIRFISGGPMNLPGEYWRRLKNLVHNARGFVQAFNLLLEVRPQAVIGVGGYASVPVVFVAAMIGIKTAIWEPNARPGLANRLLARVVKQVFLVFPEAVKRMKTRGAVAVVGMPVRKGVEVGLSQPKAIRKAEAQGPLRVLIFGGSQGSRAINRVLQALFAQKGKAYFQGRYEFLHQIGRTDWMNDKEKYQEWLDFVTPVEFLYDMPEKLQWADCAITRAGASTLAELAAFAVPSILIPLPIADGHQIANAQAFASVGAAQLLLQSDLTPERLLEVLERMRNSSELRQSMSQKINQLYKPQGAEDIANQVIQLMGEELA